MSDKKGALIIIHLRNEGACSLGKVLEKRGFRIKTVSAVSEDLNQIDPLRPELLVVMGGPIGVYQKEDYPFLKQEIEILKARLKADKPTIGICLGSQLIAAALGENVYHGAQGKELGWNDLKISPAGEQTPARHLSHEHTKMFQWHGDTFDLPEDAQLLASSEQYKNQIYSHGKNAIALQCHPEVTHSQLQEWFVMFHAQITGKDAVMPIEKLRVDTEKHIETLKTQAEKFFNEWLEERDL